MRMDDLISRQQAIDAINKALDRETLLNRLVRQVAVDAVRMVSTVHCEDCPYKERRESEKMNEQFESCDDCIYSDVEESVCVQMQCIHAFALRGGLRERFIPRQQQGTWQQCYITTPTGGQHCVWECDGCGARVAERTKYCAECGRRMTE